MLTRSITYVTCALAGAALLPSAVVRADSKASPEAAAFMQKAAIGGMAEVELGKLAQERASNPAVKQFGARMVRDHGKANAELKTLAKSKGVALPTKLDAKHASVRDELAKLSGADFDRAYVDAMNEDHEHDVAEFRQTADSGKDAEVAAFAKRTLPTLEEHLTEVQRLEGQMSSAPSGATRAATAR